ncbi:hypothetical protein HZU75_01160 [Chitinibacter fontanus]|uniref:DUF7931 domain-containing protein n=1 Tax=Chitinibacter fontanus TaxID=1737446 RepID=A0A7D5V7L8_9NEIS|nr:hypothetical protein [Chitinibacter fontanus]QLI80251.1 hypothetical protein HZU75_01160 [Chitinibacter fontanus]
MATSTPPPNNAAMKFDTRTGYQTAFNEIITQARHTLILCENDLAESDLGSLRNYQRLWDFFSQAAPGRLQVLVAKTEFLAQQCPRFLQLKDRFAHLIELRQIPVHLSHWQKGWGIADGHSYLVRHHYDWYRGELANDAKNIALLKQQFATLWEQSTATSALQRLDL